MVWAEGPKPKPGFYLTRAPSVFARSFQANQAGIDGYIDILFT